LFLFTWIFGKTLYTIVIIPIDEDLEENYEEYFPRQKKRDRLCKNDFILPFFLSCCCPRPQPRPIFISFVNQRL